jgi:hypothetical protein
MKMTYNDILTAAQAAEYLKLRTPEHVRALAAAGIIPGTQIGDDWRFMCGQLYDYLAKKAETEQLKRQSEHQIIKVAKQDGAIPPKRGRRTKASTAEIIEKYGKQYGGQ